MGGKEIKFGVDGRTAMLKGVDTLADAVQVRFLVVALIPAQSANSFSCRFRATMMWIFLRNEKIST